MVKRSSDAEDLSINHIIVMDPAEENVNAGAVQPEEGNPSPSSDMPADMEIPAEEETPITDESSAM